MPKSKEDMQLKEALMPVGRNTLFDPGKDAAAELAAALGGKRGLSRLNKRGRALLMGGGVLVVVLAVVFAMLPTAFGAAAADEVPAYRETAITRGSLTVGVSESGTIAVNTQNATSSFSGEIVELFVKAGQSVSEGDPIALLDVSDIEEQVKQLETTYKEAQIAYSEASVQYQSEMISADYELAGNEANSYTAQQEYDNTVGRLQNAVDTAYNSYNSALDKIAELEATIARYEGYVAEGYTYLSEMNASPAAAVADGETAPANTANEQTIAEKLADAKSQLKETNNSLSGLLLAIDEANLSYSTGKLEAEQRYADAINKYENSGTIYNNAAGSASLKVQKAKQALDEAKQALDEAKQAGADGYVYAPCTGLVQSINYSVGDTLNTGMPLATVTDAALAYISVSITQDDIGDVEIGKAVNISLSAFDTVYTGEVDSISTTAAREGASTVSYTVSILIEGDTSGLYTGMTGDVTFITKQVTDVLYVSNNAVYTVNGESYLKLIDADGSFVETQVETGFSDGRNVEIISGVSEGDTAIIESGAG